MYSKGEGTSKNYQAAMKWYMEAEDNGNMKAATSIAHMYENGWGVEKSIPTAIQWYTKAANQRDEIAQYNLGRIYKYERDVIDLQQAINWYEKAANNSHRPSKFEVKALNQKGYFAKNERGKDEMARYFNL
jgi:TPR repeat protein